jgi:hypothetical protein
VNKWPWRNCDFWGEAKTLPATGSRVLASPDAQLCDIKLPSDVWHQLAPFIHSFGGIATCSRWLSGSCDTTGTNCFFIGPRMGSQRSPTACWDPFGVRRNRTYTGGIAKNAQPPATSYNPSGIFPQLRSLSAQRSGRAARTEQIGCPATTSPGRQKTKRRDGPPCGPRFRRG